MPRIPLPETSGVPKSPGTVHLTGAPSGNFGMEDAAAISNAGKQLGSALVSFGDNLTKYRVAKQQAEDALAQREYLTEWTRRQNELENQMAAAPGEVENFGSWSNDADKLWERDGQVYLDRMSIAARKNFLAEHDARVIAATGRRERLSAAATATRLFNGFKLDIQKNCETGNFDAARQTVDAASAGDAPVFNPEQRQHFLEVYIPEMQDVHAVKQQIDNYEHEAVIDALEQRNQDGSFVNYTHLSAERREALIRYAQQKENEYIYECDQSYFEVLETAGRPLYSDEELATMLEKGEITVKLYQRYKQHNERFAKAETEAENQQAAGRRLAEDNAYQAWLLNNVYAPEAMKKLTAPNAAADLYADFCKNFSDERKRIEVCKLLESRTKNSNKIVEVWNTPAGKQVEASIKDWRMQSFFGAPLVYKYAKDAAARGEQLAVDLRAREMRLENELRASAEYLLLSGKKPHEIIVELNNLRQKFWKKEATSLLHPDLSAAPADNATVSADPNRTVYGTTGDGKKVVRIKGQWYFVKE